MLLLASWRVIGDFLLDGWENSRLDTELHVIIGECGVLMVMALEVQARLPAIIAAHDVEDVFNFDKTGLYYRAPPSKTLNIGWPREMKK